MAFVKLVNGQATYSFYDENSAMRSFGAAHLPEISADALFFGGISLVGAGCGQVYEDLMLQESERRVTMIDPNIRPEFIVNEAEFRARIDRMMAAADVIKLSDEDLTWLRGEGNLADLAGSGQKLVVNQAACFETPSLPSSTAARVTATRCAPRGDHLMRRRLPMRVLPMSSTQPSARDDETARPFRCRWP